LELTAFWMMFLDGYIGAPPTWTLLSWAEKADTAVPDTNARVTTAKAALSAERCDIEILPEVRMDAARAALGRMAASKEPAVTPTAPSLVAASYGTRRPGF